MMILCVFSVFDRQSAAFDRPFYTATRGTAVRGFRDAIQDKASPFHAHPDDYDLYYLGTYNDQTAVFTLEATPELVALGKNLKLLVESSRSEAG